jgi:predicted permease
LWRPDTEADIDAELRFHFEQKVADLVAHGATPDLARAQAEAEAHFGDVDAVRSNLREIDGRIAQHRQHAEWWEGIAQDVGYVLRSLRRSPAFTAMVVLTLALGIGANAAIFSLLDRMFLRAPAGVSKPNEVRRLHLLGRDERPHTDHIRSSFNFPEVKRLRAAVPAGIVIAGYSTDHVRLGPDADAPQGIASYVEGDFLGVAAVHPAAGRFFTPDETRVENITQLAVISHSYWIQRFGGNANAIGQSVSIGAKRYDIIGVAPEGFTGIDLEPVDFWVPMSSMRPPFTNRSPWYELTYLIMIRVVTRAPTHDLAARVEASATTVLREGRLFRGDTAATARLASVIEAVRPDGGGQEIAIATRLGGVAAIILLIACANVANLLLARGLQRRREIAVRLALGVSRARLVWQLLTESAVISLLGGAVALLAAVWGATELRHALLPDARWGEGAISLRLAAFTATVAVLTGLAAGLMPALQTSTPDLATSLKAGTREGTVRKSRLRSALVVVQGALSIVLLAGSGLFVRSLQHVEAVDIGYDADRLVFASVDYDSDQGNHRQEIAAALPVIAERLALQPGVAGVGMAGMTPFNGFSWVHLYLPDRDSVPTLPGSPEFFISSVSPGYFSAVGIRMQAGRGILSTDVEGSAPVIVVSALMARTIWPGENPLGKCLIPYKRTDPCRTVVGVASETHFARIIEEPSMHFYVPLAQAGAHASAGALAIRLSSVHASAAAAVIAQARSQLVGSFGRWARPTVRSMSELLAPELRPYRLGATLFAAAGLLALLVAAVGVYSTVAYTLSQRTHEMGVRVALGARGADIVRLVVGEGLRVVLFGIAIGTVVALALGRVVASMLYNTSPRDPVVLTTVVLTLLVVAVVACLVPAWRATRADPITALRAE